MACTTTKAALEGWGRPQYRFKVIVWGKSKSLHKWDTIEYKTKALKHAYILGMKDLLSE